MTKIKMKLIGFTAAAMVASVSVSAKVPKLKVNNIDAVIKAMTIEEKADLIVGARMYHQDENAAPHIKESWKVVPGAAGRINPVPRVGIPCVVLSDGPAGCGILPVWRSKGRKIISLPTSLSRLYCLQPGMSTWSGM